MNKKGQFFLLAAVVISLVIISLAATTNEVVVQSGNFEEIDDFSYQVQKETGEVLNYQIYSGITEDRVKEFTDVMAEEIQDKDPETEFIFIFGNNEGMTVSNYAQEDAVVTPIDLVEATYCLYLSTNEKRRGDCPEGGIANSVCRENLQECYACSASCSLYLPDNSCYKLENSDIVSGTEVEDYYIHGNGVATKSQILGEHGEYDIPPEDLTNDAITVTINGVDVVVPVTEHKQVFMIIKKKSGDETYIDY